MNAIHPNPLLYTSFASDCPDEAFTYRTYLPGWAERHKLNMPSLRQYHNLLEPLEVLNIGDIYPVRIADDPNSNRISPISSGRLKQARSLN